MNLVNQLKDNFTKRKMRQLDNRKSPQREFVDLEKAKNIGMIVNVNQCDTEDIKHLNKYISKLKKDNKRVFIIEINYLKKSTPELSNSGDTIFINPSKMNWVDYPIPAVEEKINQHALDILMNFDSSEKMTSKYVLSFANAKTRTGPHVEGFEYCYELMVHLPETDAGNRLQAMINQFDYFLKMIEK
jgi:hypothetical protein